MEVLQHESERARRDAGRVGVLMIGADLFRRVNDELGHPSATACSRSWPAACAPRRPDATAWRDGGYVR
jgi:predicted signal transduction protein with EAL and GGDEF domain